MKQKKFLKKRESNKGIMLSSQAIKKFQENFKKEFDDQKKLLLEKQ